MAIRETIAAYMLGNVGDRLLLIGKKVGVKKMSRANIPSIIFVRFYHCIRRP